ncbi:MlaC/ttg2D family ABC transporter substrate-binding protein [Paraglaciecola arctica]|uniref:Probable phospholipid-binding protein mlaC n=1 Tax=Paraglaciecola arctica BSs20135 TaxID=493475 RepID=K6XKR2_9ALTE|nr:ABC transporter substrate-binding protein [Paraglaciecola arctica]GAC21244.1 probable phospholipid-binding protein mlaC [Paraglaciecola arctica BSs20135]
MNTKFFKIIRELSQSVLLILVTVLANSSYAETVNPQVLLEKVTKATFERIELEQPSIQSNPDHLRVIIEQELMPYIDHKFAAFKVLGSQFRSVPKDKIPEYVDEFKEYLVSSFAVVLANYGGQELVFEPVKDAGNQNDMTIKAIIRKAGTPDIRVSFKLRKNKKTQEWKTYDLVAEGISLLSSKRNEFASMIRQEGIQAVIDEMRSKNNKPLNIASNGN